MTPTCERNTTNRGSMNSRASREPRSKSKETGQDGERRLTRMAAERARVERVRVIIILSFEHSRRLVGIRRSGGGSRLSGGKEMAQRIKGNRRERKMRRRGGSIDRESSLTGIWKRKLDTIRIKTTREPIRGSIQAVQALNNHRMVTVVF